MQRNLLINCLLLILALGLFFGTAVHAEKKILIITRANEAPYSEVLTGFKTQQKNASFIEISADNTAIATGISTDKPDLIFAIGADAADLAAKNTTTIPIIATLVLKTTLFKAANVTGVGLSYPFSTQLQWLKKFFPEQKKIAVLFDPAENANTVAELNKVFASAGLELIAIPVDSPKQLPFALEQLAQNVEVLLSIPDEVTMSPKTAKEVLLASFRNRVPLIGLSDNWVKSGALYALSWDYNDLGQQCAAQAQRLLNGESIAKVSHETPRKVAYTINSKIAEHMNITIPANLLSNAKLTFN